MTDAPPERPEKPAGGLSLRTAGLITKAPSRAPIEPKLQTLTVRMVEVNRIADIDIITQRFRAEVVLQLAFEGGAKDEDLNNPYAGFPLDSWNRPTFRPSAAWYMAQVDFNNAIEYKTLDAKIVPDGDDLLMNLRFEGVFSEIMELEDFPFDVQDLTMSLAFNTRTKGMMPLELVNSPNLRTSIAEEGFVDGKMWNLHTELDIRPGAVGSSDDRKFPSLEMVALVGRRPKFYVLNAALPVFFFVPMALLQFCCARDQTDGRLSVSLAIVLTAVAHKYSITTLVPAISYLTYLDKFVFSSASLLILITLQGGLIGSFENLYCRTQAVYEEPGDAAIRRLVAGGGAITNQGENPTMTSRQPLYFLDEDCPFASYGAFNKFDWIDASCLSFDLICWLTVQAWAAQYYMRIVNNFTSRVNKINAAREEDKRRAQKELSKKAQALTKPKRQGTCGRICSMMPASRSRESQVRIDEAVANRSIADAIAGRRSTIAPGSKPLTRASTKANLNASRKSKASLARSNTDLRNWSHLPQRSSLKDNDSIAEEASSRGAIGQEAPRPVCRISRPAPTLLWPSPKRVLANGPVANLAMALGDEKVHRAQFESSMTESGAPDDAAAQRALEPSSSVMGAPAEGPTDPS